jgi:hypothetical protein
MRHLIILFGLNFILVNCGNKRDIEKEFRTKNSDRCNLTLTPSYYKADSLLLSKVFGTYVTSKERPFNAHAYNETTLVFIDTIIYSQDMKHCAVLAIEKCFSKTDNSWAFDGGVHFVSRDDSDSLNRFKIYSNHFARHINSENYAKMSDILRANNFAGLSYEAHVKGEIGFNLDDCRFWTSDHFVNKIKTSYFVDLSE